MASWANNVQWGKLIQMTLLVIGGIGALAFGQVPIGAGLLAAAVAQRIPNDIVGAIKNRKPPNLPSSSGQTGQ